MRFHVLGLANTRTERAWSTCAYSTKVYRFCQMMKPHAEIILYSAGPSDADCAEHVQVLTEKDRVLNFGEEGRPDFSASNPGWLLFNANAANEIKQRRQPGDMILSIGGLIHQPVAHALPDMPCIEFGIGYSGTFSQLRVFESYAWMHTIYGEQQGSYTGDGKFYDTVIPNFFDPDDFTVEWEKDEYALYLGRMIDRKGVRLASDVAREAGVPLIMAGAGDVIPDYGEYVGPVGPEVRRDLLAGARVLLCPTLYIEPFGGVAVEAHLSGTPTLGPDFGAFTETIINGVNGWRCKTFDEYVTCVDRARFMNAGQVRATADRFTLDTVAPMYVDYFQRVADLYAEDGKGWYTRRS